MDNMSDIEKGIIKEAKMFIRKNKGLKIDRRDEKAFSYSSPRISSEFMDCSLPMTFDHYSYCSLGCVYCFAAMQKANNPSFSSNLHAVNYKSLIAAIKGEPTSSRFRTLHQHFFSKRFVLHWGGLADPFCNFEKENKIGYKIIKAIAEEKYPTLFSFKGSAMFRPNFEKLFSKYAHQKNFAFQASIIAPSDKMSRKIEIGVPVTSQRIKALKYLSDMGYYTILRLRPFIIGISDDGLDDLLYQAKDAGIQAVSMEFVAIDVRNSKNLSKRYKWMGELIGTTDFLKYFKALSPPERGGYMRLNRLVKERFVKQIYKFCIDNDILFACSDPDYKELNMSGSCCGMPDDYKENKEMENWSRSQLSFHLKEARKQYHLKGKIMTFKFDKVFNPRQDTYLKESGFGSDHVGVSIKTASERLGLTFLEMAKNTWNNLKSPGNPQNYFHGKMLPFRIDEKGNYVYIYKPSEYEERWAKEGIDLTK